MTGKLILVRHGQTVSNVAKKLDTLPPGAALTELGQKQATEFGKATTAERIVCSVALRARQTAEAISAECGVPVEVRDGLQETSAGDLEDRTDDEAHGLFADVFRQWNSGDLSARVPGGETGQDVLDRFVPVLESLRDDVASGDVVVVSHGAAIRLVSAHIAGVDPSFATDNHLANTETVELVPTGDGWTCVRWSTFVPPFTGKGNTVADDPMG